MRKSILLIVIFLSMAIFSCSKQDKKSGDAVTNLNVWSFTDEMKGFIADFEEEYPDSNIKLNLTFVPTEEYLSKLRPALRSKDNVPDVFTGEAAFVKELVNSGVWADLSQPPYNADTSNTVDYVVDIGTDDAGILRALSFQATAGGFFYRRSLAKQYLGTDDPDEIGKMISTMDGFIETGKKLQKASNGTVSLIPGLKDLLQFAYSKRSKPWVEDGKLVIDPEVRNIFEIAKIIRDNNLDGKVDQWTPAWFDGIKSNGKFLFYILPTWGLHFVLKPNGEDSTKDWGVTSGPSAYFWGGTWMGINKDISEDKKEAAWKFVKMVTLDDVYMEKYAKKSGDFTSNKAVTNKIKDTFSEEFLNGQNHYAFFASQLSKIKGRLLTKYDLVIQDQFCENALDKYINEGITLDEAIDDIKKNVKSAYPDIIVE